MPDRKPTTNQRAGGRDSAAPVVLFFTDNGHGLGHVTRMMAVAKQADHRFRPMFITMSAAFPILRSAGFPSEYFPSYRRLGLAKDKWNPLFESRLASAIAHAKPKIVVVDHIGPPAAIASVRARTSGVQFIWSRRGLWRQSRNAQALSMSKHFDLIVEPGDIAGPIDMGLTTLDRKNVVGVPPIVLVDREEFLPRTEARAQLGIPGDGRVVLIQLSDSSPEKLRELIDHVRSRVATVAAPEQIDFFAPLHALHGEALSTVEGVVMRPVYPVARYLNAFDGVISTAGYNSYHEIVMSGLPAIFVARDTDSLDDQQRRAFFAELCGRAFWSPSVYDEKFEDAVQRMLDPWEMQIGEETAAALGQMNGAARFADLLAERCEAGASVPLSIDRSTSDRQLVKEALEALPARRSKSTLSRLVPRRVVVISAVNHDTTELGALVEEAACRVQRRSGVLPVFLACDILPGVIDSSGFPFETVMTEAEWRSVGDSVSYSDYVRQRIDELIDRYSGDRVITAAPGAPLAEW